MKIETIHRSMFTMTGSTHDRALDDDAVRCAKRHIHEDDR